MTQAVTLDAAQQAIVEQQRKEFVNWPTAPIVPSQDNPLGRRRGVDDMTIRRMEKLLSLEHRLRVTGVQPATVLTMNPYPLRVNGVLMDDITVPACPRGKPWVLHVIRDYRISWRDEQDDNWTPVEWVPVMLAREFESTYYNNGGVVIFTGDATHDSSFLNHPAIVQNIKEAKARLIAYAWGKKRDADGYWNAKDGFGFRNISDVHRSLTKLLIDEGELAQAEQPPWLEKTKADANLGEACPRCKAEPIKGAYMCSSCGYILDPKVAFEAGEIDEENSALRRLSRKELDEIGISEHVDETLEERKLRLGKGEGKQHKKKTQGQAAGGQTP